MDATAPTRSSTPAIAARRLPTLSAGSPDVPTRGVLIMGVQPRMPESPRFQHRLTRRGAIALVAGTATPLFLRNASWRGERDALRSQPLPRGSYDASYSVVRVIGGPGVGEGQFRFPWHLAVGGRGELLIADSQNRRIQRFSQSGAYRKSWRAGESSENSGVVQFLDPRGLACDARLVTYVADAATDRVQAFAPDGTLLAAWGTRGHGTGQFRAPNAVAVSFNGEVYVVDTGNHRVQIFDTDGLFLGQCGSQGEGLGQFHGPLGIAIGPDAHVVVADSGNHRMQMFSADGTFIRAWGSKGAGDGEFTLPVGVAFDVQGHVLVTDAGNHRVQRFASDGGYRGQWGTPGTGAGQLAFPQGIATAVDGLVHVADAGNHRLQTFALV
jgi:tripartite motif-containing protein 71